ncbi:unnamed protein product [Porites evermanni]|uniref:Ig-like domain-containing protein n=1 Tax=Porites evermanni TaxID=104178 RepID=A0ABN8T2S3_9CNID|nr:unnamed protein product [Porites evermanni]
MGPSGRHGKQGIMGSPGIKGEKGQKGAVGPRGMMGLKGDPGESISLPVAVVSPNTQTVRENHSATFYCSASGNPKPTVTWTKVKGSLRNNIAKLGHGGRLDIIHSTFNDSGEYKCIAVNMLGQDEKIVELIVEVSPRFTRVPGRFLVIEEEAVASVTCEAFSYPPSVITWTRPLVALPRGRSSVTNGTLTIQDFSAVDTGTYVCTAKNKLGSVTAVMALNIQRTPDSCKAAVSKHSPTGGTYDLKVNSNKFQVYCDVKTQGSHWTLIARFSNRDTKNWMRDDGHWWYDQNASMGTTTDPSVNTDMISPAFWLVSGREFKVTRSDDSSHTPLLQTTGNCLGGQTFRSKVTSYGDFRNGKVWSSKRGLGSCTVQYGGQYKTTHGFGQAECSSNIQSSNKIGFWCDWDGGDGSVMMIGGGGSGCDRADHGIGITETGDASFVEVGYTETEYDFGNDADTRTPPTKSYSLNLWIR